ncbi:MAG: STAS domain-containing protein [Endozoicomonadaceae bacterium]|nr:STAS domain-containing protein [Endozoicomonadaceae bacterium]
MGTVELIAPGRLALCGSVDVDTVAELEQSGLDKINRQSSAEWMVDLSAVTRADSAALAMMLSWMRSAEEKKVKLMFTGLPDELQALAGVCGVDVLLPIV